MSYRRLLIASAAVLSLTVPLTTWVHAQAPVGWVVEVVDGGGDVGWFTSLALDGAGRPHISYYDGSRGALKYALLYGTSWRIQVVDRAGRWGTSLVLDGAGWPHISYRDEVNRRLKYAYYGGTEWLTGTVAAGAVLGDVGYWNDLALDGAGRPHISYRDLVNRSLEYAHYDGTAWQVETVDGGGGTGGDVGSCTSLALDGAGRPHISYYDQGQADLKYAHFDGATWQIETVDAGGLNGDGDVGQYTSLALDGAGRPHISYLDADEADLKYAFRDATGWHVETVDREGRVGRWTSLALDSSGRPHISYWDGTNGDLKYAYHDGVDWQVEVVDSEGIMGEYTSLALDGAGRPHISYYDYTGYALKYAYRGSVTPLPDTGAGPELLLALLAAAALTGLGWMLRRGVIRWVG
jgi:hypothetical protein